MMCVCKKGYWPNDEGTMCNQKSDEVWDFNKCVDVNPDVIDVVCPADKCGENEVCKIIQVRNHFAKKSLFLITFSGRRYFCTKMCLR